MLSVSMLFTLFLTCKLNSRHFKCMPWILDFNWFYRSEFKLRKFWETCTASFPQTWIGRTVDAGVSGSILTMTEIKLSFSVRFKRFTSLDAQTLRSSQGFNPANKTLVLWGFKIRIYILPTKRRVVARHINGIALQSAKKHKTGQYTSKTS